MKRIELTIKALSPLAIGQRKPGGSVSEALDYIPGTVIRGAIAKEILRHSDTEPTAGDDFHKLFLDKTAAIFGNAYPAIAQIQPDKYRLSTDPVQVIPASALSTKTSSGFKPVKAGVFDSLIDSFCAKEQGHFYVPNDLEGDLVDAFTGFYSKSKQGYVSHKVSKRLLTRVGINRKRATAQDEILYSIEVMNESQGKHEPQNGKERVQTVYRSSILAQDTTEFANNLWEFLQQNCTHLRLGGSASRGLGKVRLISAKPVDETDNPIKNRVEAFNKTLKKRWDMWSVLGDGAESPTEKRSFFSITLHADAILSENWRRTMVISPAMLAPLIGLSANDIYSHMVYSGYDYRSGWNAAWGLPKDTELMTKMGGVMMFSIPKDWQNECYKDLANLERVGIGSRCSEGYGQLKVCDEFHQIMREAAV
ncbi:MAG: CRISPR-associated RAMP protein Csx10 [Phormidesmis sp.]